MNRQEPDCPICLTSVAAEDERSQTLTSCSHLFHDTCLTMFETLTRAESSCSSCPVCRSVYQKQLIKPRSGTLVGVWMIITAGVCMSIEYDVICWCLHDLYTHLCTINSHFQLSKCGPNIDATGLVCYGNKYNKCRISKVLHVFHRVCMK